MPRFKKVEKEKNEDDESQFLIGFIAVTVFAVEDTDGEPLPDLTPHEIPQQRVLFFHVEKNVTHPLNGTDNFLAICLGILRGDDNFYCRFAFRVFQSDDTVAENGD